MFVFVQNQLMVLPPDYHFTGDLTLSRWCVESTAVAFLSDRRLGHQTYQRSFQFPIPVPE
jgi:hypothetical protein